MRNSGYLDGEAKKAATDPTKQQYLNLIRAANSGSSSLSKVGDSMRKSLTDVSSERAKALRDGTAAVLTGRTRTGASLSRGAELGLHTSLDKQLGIISDAGCKSGQDRTLHLHATDMANRAVRELPGMTTEKATAFAENFDQLAKLYDTGRGNGTSMDAMTQSARLLGGTIGDAREMMQTYRDEYLKTAVEQGLPMTQYSTLLPGLKWHGEDRLLNGLNPGNWFKIAKSYFSENRLPVSSIPDSITVGGKKTDLLRRNWLNQRVFTPEGSQYIKGLGRFRST